MDFPIHGFKVANGETRFGKQYKMKGVTLNALDLKVSSKDTNGAQAVFVQTGFTSNGGPPLHIHYNQDEIFYILEGEYQFQVGEERFSMKQGDTIFLPKNVPHAFIQLTDIAKVIVTFQPAGKMEDFFRITDEWTTPPTKEEAAKVFEDHEMKIVGPPLKREE
ncbi:MAG: cupin domain-containing protein [Ignavibacteriota bacterium]